MLVSSLKISQLAYVWQKDAGVMIWSRLRSLEGTSVRRSGLWFIFESGLIRNLSPGVKSVVLNKKDEECLHKIKMKNKRLA